MLATDTPARRETHVAAVATTTPAPRTGRGWARWAVASGSGQRTSRHTHQENQTQP